MHMHQFLQSKLQFEIHNIMIVAKTTTVVLLAILAAVLSVGAARNFEEKRGLVIKELSAEKVEGEYHGETGNIQFSSTVRGDDRSFTVASSTAEGDAIILSIKKPEKVSMMTVKMGQTKLLVQMNQPGSGLPRYSDYVVLQALHNLMDSAMSQDFILHALIQLLDSRNTDEIRRRAIEDLAMHSEASSIVEAAKSLGNAGVMGTESPAAQQFYVLAMHLAKVKEMTQRGAVATSDGTLPTRHSFQHMHSIYAYEQVNSSCPECTTGSCPYMGDQSYSCNGMCGLSCNCWSFICRDCCVHQGCLDHDNCCARDGYFSYSCTFGLVVSGFSCSGYPC